MTKRMNTAPFLNTGSLHGLTVHKLNRANGNRLVPTSFLKYIRLGGISDKVLVNSYFEFIGQHHDPVFFAFATPDRD